MINKNEILAVVKINTKTIKSEWYVKRENGTLEDVTLLVFDMVHEYNTKSINTNKLFIPYSYKNGFITYSFGCGLTHYLQDNNVNEVLKELNVERIRILTQKEFKQYAIDQLKGN